MCRSSHNWIGRSLDRVLELSPLTRISTSNLQYKNDKTLSTPLERSSKDFKIFHRACPCIEVVSKNIL